MRKDGAVHRVFARLNPGVVPAPRAAVDHHLVADFDVGDVLADLVDDAAGVAPADVEVLRFAGLVARCDDVDRNAEAGPYVVVVDAGRHDVDQHLVVGGLWNVDCLDLPRLSRLAEAFRPYHPGVHFGWHVAQRWLLADGIQILPFIHGRSLLARFRLLNKVESGGKNGTGPPARRECAPPRSQPGPRLRASQRVDGEPSWSKFAC